MPIPSLGLFSVSNPLEKSNTYLSQAGNTFASMDKKGPEAPKKTVGGGLMSAAGMGMAGAQAGTMIAGGTAAAGAGTAAAGAAAAGSAAGGAATGAAAGSMAGPIGMAIGAGVGALAYFLS